MPMNQDEQSMKIGCHKFKSSVYYILLFKVKYSVFSHYLIDRTEM